MKTLNRLLLLALCLTLVAAAFAIYSGTTQVTVGHDTFSYLKRPWLHELREISLFGVLIWCVLFLRREPTLARVGLIAVVLAFAVMALPPKILKQPITLPGWR